MDKKQIRAIISIIIMAVFILATFAYFFIIEKKLEYREVVVLITPIKKGDVVSADNLQLKDIDKNAVIEGAITEDTYPAIVGKTSMQYIPANSQLVYEYFDEEIQLKEGEVIFQIPIEWVYVLPQSIRRLDTVKIYIIHQNDLVYTEPTPTPTAEPTPSPTPAYAYNSNVATPIPTVVPTLSPTPTVSPAPTIDPKIAVLDFFFDEHAKMIFEATVMYIKDTTNREIQTITSNTGYDRLDATAKNYTIEIIATDEMINQMKEAVKNGYKFIVVYE